MTPQEKADELVHKYVDLTDGWVYGIKNWNYKKQCALIAVNEVLSIQYLLKKETWFYKEVKKEIEKL